MHVSKLLLQYADINAKNPLNGKTPLHVTCGIPCYFRLTKILVENGADATIQDDEGRTPLVVAANTNSDSYTQKVVWYLVRHYPLVVLADRLE